MKKENREKLDFSGIEFIISDWDGTLVDSMSAYTRSFAQVLDEAFHIDKTTSAKFFMEKAGLPLSLEIKEAAQQFANKHVEDSKQLEEAFWNNLVGTIPELLPGSREFLENLRKKGKKIVIWSGSRTDVLGKAIEEVGFSPLIDFYIGNYPGDDKLVKGPGLFRIIAGHFGEKPEELAAKTLVIGEGIGDIEAGKAIGALTAGYGDSDNPNFSQADFVFSDYDSLVEMFG